MPDSKKPESSGPPDPQSLSSHIHRLHVHLAENAIHFLSYETDQFQVFRTLIHSLDLDDYQAAYNRIVAREQMGSTLPLPGVSFPHARLKGLDRVVAALGLHKTGVPSVPPGEEPLKIFLLFFSPYDQTRAHLDFLVSASALFQVDGLSERLLNLSTPADVLQAIRSIEATL